MSFNLNLDKLSDPLVRETFQKLQEQLDERPLIQGTWEFFEIEVDGSVSDFEYPHNLGFTPQDVIQTSEIGSGTITWNYDKFDSENINFSTTGSVTVRAFIGSYYEEGEDL